MCVYVCVGGGGGGGGDKCVYISNLQEFHYHQLCNQHQPCTMGAGHSLQ